MKSVELVSAAASDERQPPLTRSWLVEFFRAEDGTPGVRAALRWFRGRLLGQGSKSLRTIFIASLVVQLLLAPLTSWSIDTPAFVGSAIALVYRGSPYAANQFFNPPLGPFLEAPFFGLLALWQAPQSLITTVTAITPAASVTGISTQIPSPAALVALKLPLILASLLAGACVLYLAERFAGRSRSTLVAGAWLCNPLVIWATAVHGEVDVLAAAAVLLFLVSILQRWYVLGGVALGLGIMSKAYPVLLLPMALIAINYRPGHPSGKSPVIPILRFLSGVGLAVLPFIRFLPNLESIDGGLSTEGSYGGFNALLLFNPTVFLAGPRIDASVFSATTAVFVREVFTVLFVVALAGSVLLAYVATYLSDSAQQSVPARSLMFALVWPLAGVLLFQTSPQSENLLLLLSVTLVLSCFSGLSASVPYWTLSAAGLLLYFALDTPVAYFYPLAAMGGSSWISAVNSVVIRYHQNTLLPYQDLWVVAGIMGAACILWVWALSAAHVAHEFSTRVRAGLAS